MNVFSTRMLANINYMVVVIPRRKWMLKNWQQRSLLEIQRKILTGGLAIN